MRDLFNLIKKRSERWVKYSNYALSIINHAKSELCSLTLPVLAMHKLRIYDTFSVFLLIKLMTETLYFPKHNLVSLSVTEKSISLFLTS